MKKIIGILFVLLSVLFMFGCTGGNICGNEICEVGEEMTCPTDCAEQVDGQIEVRVDNPWVIDEDQDLSIYWYKNSNVSVSLNSSVSSRLTDTWSGNENKNLYLSFNDNESGEIPLNRNEDKIIIDNLTQGEYYFEVRTSDYQYRGVSDKVIVKNDGNHVVNLELYPSNPVIRVKALSTNHEILTGPAQINVFMIKKYKEFGEYKEEEFLFSSADIEKGNEINQLFYVSSDKPLDEIRVRYRIEIIFNEKTAEMYVWPNRQFQERVIYFEDPNAPKTDFKLNIVPGEGTTLEDVEKLNGEDIEICSGICYSAEVNDGEAFFEDVPFGKYWVNIYYSKEKPIVSVSSQIEVRDFNEELTVTALKGASFKISVFDSDNKLIPGDEVDELIKKMCSYEERYSREYCNIDNIFMFRYNNNPLENYQPITLYDLENRSEDYVKVIFEYEGQEKEFKIYPYKQGYHEYNWYLGDESNLTVDLSIKLVDSQGQLINSQEITVLKDCIRMYGNQEVCMNVPYTWTHNPWDTNWSYADLNEADYASQNRYRHFTLEYNGIEKDFSVPFSPGVYDLNWVFDESDGSASLTVNIGANGDTTLADVESLNGKTLTISREGGVDYSGVIDDGEVVFSGLPEGNYALKNFDLNHKEFKLPLFLANPNSLYPTSRAPVLSIGELELGDNQRDFNLGKGYSTKINILDAQGDLIPFEDLNIYKYCLTMVSTLTNQVNNSSCGSDVWIDSNPFVLSGDRGLFHYSDLNYAVKYDGQDKVFDFPMDLGLHEVDWVFD